MHGWREREEESEWISVKSTRFDWFANLRFEIALELTVRKERFGW